MAFVYIACKAKEAAARIPRLFPRSATMVGGGWVRWEARGGYVCNFETKEENRGGGRLKGLMSRCHSSISIVLPYRLTVLFFFFFLLFFFHPLFIPLFFYFFLFFLVIQDLINLFGPEDLFRINSLWPPGLF